MCRHVKLLWRTKKVAVEVDHDFGVERGIFELIGAQWAFFPARLLIRFVHGVIEFASADFHKFMAFFCWVERATDLERIDDVVDGQTEFAEDVTFKGFIMNDFDDVWVGKDDVESADIDAEGVDEKRAVVATDLDEA